MFLLVYQCLHVLVIRVVVYAGLLFPGNSSWYFLERACGISWQHDVYLCLCVCECVCVCVCVCVLLSVLIRYMDVFVCVSLMYFIHVMVCWLMFSYVLVGCIVHMCGC